MNSTNLVTPSYSDCIGKRLRYLDRIKTSDQVQVELALCRRNVSHWLAHWGWTYDPRNATSTIPFDPFPRQIEFINWLQEHEQTRTDGLVEKSRDMGITWLACAYAIHGWLFREGYSVGFGSRKLELVDTLDDMDSILEKCRFLLDNLPRWMLPPGYDRRKHANHCKIINPHNGSAITGEGGSEIGRGGRQSIYFVDEAAFLEHPDQVERSMSQTTNCRIDISTPNGPGNPFAQKRFSGTIDVFTFHWRDDPRKDDEWYADFRARKGPVVTAQELDIDYSASIEGIAIPAAWVRAAVNLLSPADHAHGPVVAGLDIAEEGADLTVFIARQGPCARVPIAWSKTNTTETAWRARDIAASEGVSEVRYDVGGVGAGVRGTWNTAERPLTFRTMPINAGESPTENRWPDGQTSKEKFRNLRAEMWWSLRGRFEKAYEFKEKGVVHPPEEMVSIPDHPQLIAELSMPLMERTETGKMQLEPKTSMRRRGVKSPDYADALCLAFFEPQRKLSLKWY